jgi:phosphoesterase RecJ-like protein
MQEALESSKATKILIDHHISPNEDFFDVIVSDTEVSSACELLYQILKGFVSTDALPIECCNSLFSGLLTDTNNFNNSIYPQTLNMAAELLARGVDRNYIYQNIFCSYSRSRVELMGMVLNQRLKFIHNGEVAYMLLSMKDKVDYSFQKGDSEGFVNIPLCIGDVKISAIFTEYEDQIRVSLRSKGDIDVNSFCRRYCNGGGHKNASGGKLLMPLECVGDYFERSINEFLGE